MDGLARYPPDTADVEGVPENTHSIVFSSRNVSTLFSTVILPGGIVKSLISGTSSSVTFSLGASSSLSTTGSWRWIFFSSTGRGSSTFFSSVCGASVSTIFSFGSTAFSFGCFLSNGSLCSKPVAIRVMPILSERLLS